MKHKIALRTTVLASVFLAGSAWATDGYFPHGYGMKAKGMGGVSIAMTDQAFAGANNPAVASFAGNRAELGVDVFMPKRGASRTVAMTGDVESDTKSFLVPEFGYNTPINDKVAVGLSVYGNGGMNTDYANTKTDCGMGAGPTSNLLCGPGRLGIDMMQLIVAPTVSYKVDERHAVGVSPLLVYQRFKAEGLEAFGQMNMSSDPGRLTGNGYDSSTGIGVRLGYVGKPNDLITFGASWSPKTKMKKFDKYAGLFAGGGGFDIPENYGVGLALKVMPSVTLAADYQRINYSKVPSIGNFSTNTPMDGQPPKLGSDSGSGFGWSDVNVIKLGVQWHASEQWTLRAGYNKTDNPIQSRDVTFNIIAPGVITKHYTLGGTYALGKDKELSFAYMHAPQSVVTGGSMFGQAMTETIRMSQQSLGVQYGWKF